MIRLSAKARIAMGMAMLVVTMLMLLSMTGVIPDHRKTAMWGRCAVSELIALQIRPVILQKDLQRMEGLLETIVNRNDEILSGAVRRKDGELVVTIGDHNALWDTGIEVSDDRQVYVPLDAGGENWGRVEICFTPLVRRGIAGVLDNPMNRLSLLMGLMCWAAFYLYLRKMLNHLDPSRAVPGRVRSALDTLGDGLLVLNREEKIVLANRSLAESIGSTPEELLGVEAASLPWALNVGDLDESEFPWTRAIHQQRSVHGEMLRYRRDGEEDAVFQISCSPVPGSDGKPQGVLVSLDDVTELEETKQQLSQAKDTAEAANHAKSNFLANMSHEIRTPMNAILGFTEVLRRDMERDEGKRRKHLNTIHSSGTHLLNLINDILDLSKVEAGRLEVESIPCAAHLVIADVVTVMGVRAEEKGIGLDCQFDGEIPEKISSDPARLRQILTNLVGNAIKFTEKGGVRIITKLQNDPEKQPQLAIQVVDTGIGMTPEAAAKIFDPFSQADASVTRRFGGTGLGLSISKRFAEAMGGGIRVHSEPGVGSVFTVMIDTGSLEGVTMIQPTEEDLESSTGEEEHLDISLPNIRVLLVDDGDENRDLMSLILEEAGATYATAQNGLEAVELATSQSWDVILMDMQMPVMDGYTATRTLRQQGYDRPIIALTAHAMQQAEQKCRDAGCSGFLSKPIEFDKLIATLAEIAGVEVQKSKPVPVVNDTPQKVSPAKPSANQAKPPANQAKPPTSEVQPPTNDMSPVRSALAMRGSTFQSIIVEFAERLPLKHSEMVAALDKEEFSQLADLAHWLKGSGPNVGFTDFADPAKQLEHFAREGDAQGAAEMIAVIGSIIDRIDVSCDTSPPSKPVVGNKQPAKEEPSQGPLQSTLPMQKPKFRDIVTRFVARLDERFDAMQQALEQEDIQLLVDQAHALKGASANCGFAQIATLAGTLERSSRDNDIELIPDILRELRELRDRIELNEVSSL